MWLSGSLLHRLPQHREVTSYRALLAMDTGSEERSQTGLSRRAEPRDGLRPDDQSQSAVWNLRDGRAQLAGWEEEARSVWTQLPEHKFLSFWKTLVS